MLQGLLQVDLIHRPAVAECPLFCAQRPAGIEAGSSFVLRVEAFHGNPFDGHTLKPGVADIEKNTGLEGGRIHVDEGYRGHNYPNRFPASLSPAKSNEPPPSSIESVIGHIKAEHQMNCNYLNGRDGDGINAVLAAGFNFHLLLRWLAALLRAYIS